MWDESLKSQTHLGLVLSGKHWSEITSRPPFKMSSQQAQITTSAPGKLWGGRFTGERSSRRWPRITLLRLDRGPGPFNAKVQRLYIL